MGTDLDELEFLYKQATEAPWERSGAGVVSGPRVVCVTGGRIVKPDNLTDAELIVAMHSALPQLIREARSYRESQTARVP